MQPDPRYTFETFVLGRSNALAVAAAKEVAEAPGTRHNPLFIYGASSFGKTHLMRAIGNEILRRDGDVCVAYVSSEQWMTQYMSAMRHDAGAEFKARYRSADALLIDDIEFFTGKPSTQEEFFRTFDRFIDYQQQIVLTCGRFPMDLDRLDVRFKNRFSSGLMVAVEPPDFETRVAILIAKAGQFSMSLSDEVAFFIAQHVRSNVRELEGVLLRLSASMRARSEAITVEFVRHSLRDTLAHYEHSVIIDNILSAVSKYYQISLRDLRSTGRSRMLVRQRQVAMSLAGELTGLSLADIGYAFGRDSTAAFRAAHRISELRRTDPRIREDYENLLKQLSD